MVIQPIFSIENIISRCKYDITTFTNNNKIKMNNIGFTKNEIDVSIKDITLISKFTSVNSNTSVSNMKLTIKKIIGNMNTILHQGKYVDEISHLSDSEQKKMWILRTVLFYQLLIILVNTLTNKDIYDEIYSDKDKYPYRADVSTRLTDFKMGIFGSMNPTSDIDLGVEYTGDYSDCEPALSYIVSRIECLFLSLTGKKSLDFDIETYADMATIPNKDKNDPHVDIFYLSTYTFDKIKDKDNFLKLVECAANSIIRNYLLAHTDTTKTKNITLDKMIKELKLNLDEKTKKILNKNTEKYLKKSFDTLTEFFTMDYDKQRYTYYTKVEYAENLKRDFTKNKNIYNLSNDDTAELIYRIGVADTYRMESYCCIPTIIHVVRILQQQQQQKTASADKYETLFPKDKDSIKKYCENIKKTDYLSHFPVCTIGDVGYILSMLEQIGYMYRFHLTYCVGNKDQQKCDKKIKKYRERYDDALQKMSKIEGEIEGDIEGVIEGEIEGGRRVNKRIRLNMKRYTKKKKGVKQIVYK